MNGKKAKAVRRIARCACDASITTMLRRGYKVPTLFARDMNGKVIEHEGKPVVLQAEYIKYTAFWPRNSYRRVLREIKIGKGCAWIDDRS